MWSQDEPRDTRVNPTRPAQGDTPAERRAGDAEGRTPNLGRSVLVKGEITGSEDLALDGRVEGRIDLPDHVLTIGPNATVHAEVRARVVMIFGTVVGRVTARERVEVRLGGSLEGHLVAPRISIQDGAHLSGKVEMPVRALESVA